jgi:hypothetical protein
LKKSRALPADQYYSATASVLEDAGKLIEDGFEYVKEMGGIKLFRERK